jgi:hypothetical protein
VRRAALVLLALTLTGCETTAEKSAKLERAAQGASHGALASKGLSITRPSAYVTVLGASFLEGSEGGAVAVTLRNGSSRLLQAVPIAITVKGAGGRTLAQNNAPGLEAALVSISSLAPHAELTWIDDQLPSSKGSTSVEATVGEAASIAAAPPRIVAGAVHLIEEASGVGAVGIISNRSAVTQRKLVVYVIARRGGKIVAGARAVLAEVAAGASVPFQAFFTGDPHGAQLQASAPPTTFA